MTKKTPASRLAEERALRDARRSLARRDLEAAARAYDRAAGERERYGEDGFAHRLRALDLLAAAGRARRVIEAGSELLRRSRRRSGKERAELRLRLGRARLELGRASEAGRDFLAAARLAPRDGALALEARLGRARAGMRAGSAAAAFRALGDLAARAERRGAARVASEAARERGRLLVAIDHPAHALREFEHAVALADEFGYRAGVARASVSLAEAALRLGLEDEARLAAERTREIARSLHDGELLARAELARARAEAMPLLREERRAERRAEGGRRRIVRRLRAAREGLDARDHGDTLARIRLLEARLASRSSRAPARTAAARAERLFRARGLTAEALQARSLAAELSSSPPDSRRRRALASTAERCGAWRLAAQLYTRRAEATPDELARAHACIARAIADPRGAEMLPDPLRPGAAARALAERTAEGAPEPRGESLRWTLAGRRAEQIALAAMARPADARSFTGANARRAVFDALQRDAPHRRARRGPRALAVRAIGERELRAPAIRGLRESEALVVFAADRSAVRVWVVRREGVVLHADVGARRQWEAAAVRLRAEANDARGWPDGAVPETSVRSATLELRRIGTRIWTPLFPALRGAARVWVAPDPALDSLPHSGLVLAAEPREWPRPRALGHLADPLTARSRTWRRSAGRSLAIGLRDPERDHFEREAAAVARITRGQAVPSAALAIDSDGAATALARRLRAARLWHVAAPVQSRTANPLWSTVDLGAESFRLIELAWLPRSLRLAVLPYVVEPPPEPSRFGRVVGSIGPGGARGRTTSRHDRGAERLTDGVPRALLALGVERTIVNAWPADEGATTGLLGSFYAGLARGDAPMESLFLAQRKAWAEGLHPIAWAGFACWGWR